MSGLVRKTCGKLALTLAPELGGAIASLTWGDTNILRPLPTQGERRANLAGCFPLAPYSNRIANGTFTFSGEHIELAKNFGDHPHSIHGNSWQLPWQLINNDETGIMLALHHNAEGQNSKHWPWSYKAMQYFVLNENSLKITLSYLNLAEHAVPVGLGFHPYFANANEAEVQFIAERVLLNDENHLPQDEVPVPPQWNYEHFRRPLPASVDNCFTGWSGKATVRWPHQRVQAEISSTDTHNAVFFIPPAEKNFVAIEPVTNINNAINDLSPDSNRGAMHLVASKERFSIMMTIKVSDYE